VQNSGLGISLPAQGNFKLPQADALYVTCLLWKRRRGREAEGGGLLMWEPPFLRVPLSSL
jgi:hypothetical protein